MIAFLPEVSALMTMRGFQPRNSFAVSEAPVRITDSTSGWLTRRLPASASSALTSCTRSSEMPASRRMPMKTSAMRSTCGAGLMIAQEPAASAAKTPPSGMAIGKFHGGVITTDLYGVNTEPRTWSSWRALSA